MVPVWKYLLTLGSIVYEKFDYLNYFSMGMVSYFIKGDLPYMLACSYTKVILSDFSSGKPIGLL